MITNRIPFFLRLAVAMSLSFMLLAGLTRAAGPTSQETGMNPAGQVFEINRDAAGNLWVSDSGAGEIRKVDPATGAYTVFQGLTDVIDARMDAAGNVWWSDSGNDELGRLSPGAGTVTKWSLPGTPLATAIDALGQVWLSDSFETVVHRFNPSSTTLYTYSIPDGGASEYILAHAGNLWLGDWVNSRILRLNPSSNLFTMWQLPTTAFPEGLAVDAQGHIWWADANLSELGRLVPASNQLTRYTLPAVGTPAMIAASGGSVWYTEDSNGTVGVLNPSVAGGVTSTALRTTASVPPTSTDLGSGTTSSITTSTGVAAWSAGALTLQTDSGGWTVYQLPAGASPWGITVNDGRVWIVDAGRQLLAWLCYWADLDCGCSVGAEDLAKAAGSWRCSIGDACFEPRADHNNDQITNIQDLMFFAGEWGWTCAP